MTFQQVLDTPGLPASIHAAVALTSSRTLRNMVTIGGEIGLLPADSPLLCVFLTLGARIVLAGGAEPIPIERHLAGAQRGLILSVAVDGPPPLSAVLAVSRTSHGARSLVAAVAARSAQAEVRDPRIVIGDGSSAPIRLPETEGRLRDAPLAPKARIEEWVSRELHPAADFQASAEYKRYIAGVLVADALHGLARPAS